MISIPLWLFVIFSVLSAIGAIALLLLIYAHIRAKMYEKAEIEIVCGRKER